MSDFMKGFIIGMKETPRGFFAPLLLVKDLLDWMSKVTERGLQTRK
jgi:hypothetical protein